MSGAATREGVLEALREVMDPELGCDVVTLGLVYGVQIDGHRVRAEVTMTTPGCPAQDYILAGVHERLLRIPGVEDAEVSLVWDPPWTPGKISAEAKVRFGIREDEY